MKYRQKLLLDRFLGYPIGLAFDCLAYVAGLILRRNHEVRSLNGKVICILKILGMGSIIEFSPALKEIKRAFPGARVIFITSKANASLLAFYADYVDLLLLVDDSSIVGLFRSTAVALWRVMRERVDTFVNLEVYSSFASILSLLSLARNRFGFYRKSTAFRKALDTHLIYFNTQRNVREIYGRIVELLGSNQYRQNNYIDLQPSLSARESVNTFLVARGILRFVVINPNASELMPERRWPPENWRAIIEAITASHDLHVLLSGSYCERRFVESEIQSALSPRSRQQVHVVAGLFSLAEFTACLRRAALFITNDSGPYHIGAVLDVPMISLWGPGDPRHYALQSPRELVHYAGIYCSPCLYHVDAPPCGGKNSCMQLIRPSSVMSSVRRVLPDVTADAIDPLVPATSYRPGICINKPLSNA